MKINLHQFLSEEQQDEIYEIIKDLKLRIKRKEISRKEAYLEIRYGKRFKEWMNSIKDIDAFYDAFLPKVHERLLDGYRKIFQNLVDNGVLIASNAGTQLGIIRDGSLIEWDDDIDLIMDIKDFNKYKGQIKKNALLNGWVPIVKNWIKDDFSTYKNKGKISVQFFYKKRIKLDFGRVESSFFPFMDLFPGIRVNEKISREKIEDISLSLVKYYDSFDSRETQKLVNNRKIENRTPKYFESLKKIQEQNLSITNEKAKLYKNIKNNYDNDGKSLMQVHVASPLFSIFNYKEKNTKEIIFNDKKYRFIISDNFEEQLSMEYGENWREPRRSHVHFLLIWFAKLKK